jgi:hypothetical protein
MDLKSAKSFRTSLTNAAVISGFYDLHLGRETVSSENWLSVVEGQGAAVLAKLANQPSRIRSLSFSEEVRLARFVTAQIFRVPAFRAWEEAKRAEVVRGIKKIAEGYIRKQAGDAADEAWAIWDSEPDWRWLQQAGPIQEAELSSAMMQELQGWANIIRAMPWRSGRAVGSRNLYTSDNPVAAYLPPIRPWWSGGAIWEYTYYFPVTHDVLVVIGPYGYTPRRGRKGQRGFGDFTEWESSFARHLVTANASRFLYGDGPYVPRNCAEECLRRITLEKIYDATRFHGFDPSAGQGMRRGGPAPEG